MSGARLRIAAKAALDDLPKNIILTGKGVRRVNLLNEELYDRTPIETPQQLGVNPPLKVDGVTPFEADVDVFAGKEASGTLSPEMDLGGVYQVVLDELGAPVVHVSPEGVNLWILQKVEFIRNPGV